MHTYTYTVNNFIGCDTTTVKKIGLVGLYSGRQIKAKAAKGESITRSQSAKGALAAIKKKYGEVPDSAKFVHKGKGLWVRYSLANDKRRTGNVTEDIKKWRRQPNKYDYKGIDTASVKKAGEVKKRKVAVKKPTIRKSKKSYNELRVDNIPHSKVEDHLTITAKTMFLRELHRTGITYTATDSINGKKMKLSNGRVFAGMFDWEQFALAVARDLKDEKPKVSKFSTVQIRKPQLKLAGRTTKTAIKATGRPVLKTVEKPKVRAKVNLKGSLGKLAQKKPVGRSIKKIPNITHAVTTKLTDIKNKVYMKNSPFTSLQVQTYNSYSFYDADINKDFNNEVARIEKLIKSKFPSGAPAEVLQAVDRYRRYIYESYLSESKARMTAPSQAVVGPAGYKNFDKKRARADNIRSKSRESLDYAKKQLDLAIRRSNIKVGVEKISQKYGVRVGDKVNLYWTNNYKKYKMPATVSKINENTLVGKLLEPYNGYPIGKEISVPMIGTAGNKWEHIGKDKPKVDSNKETLNKFYEQNKGYFKVGDKVDTGFYGKGVIVKVNKATVVVQVPPVYSGDKGLRKLTNHPQAMKKL
ncbi:MAG: hypothetical protein WCQ65_10210 [Fermentimonas sp.]